MLMIVFTIASCNNNNISKKTDAQTQKPENTFSDSSPKQKIVLFFGNSLTAGYGLEPTEAFPALIQNKIDSLHLSYKTINAGVSGETSAGGLGRIDWILRQPIDVFVLELGGNDGLRGIPLAETRKNLQAIINKVKNKYPKTKIVLAGMQIPPNMGEDYTTAFKKIYPDLAMKNNLILIPFLLQGVGGDPKLNQDDGIHPNATGEQIVAGNVWQVLEKICR